MVIGSAMLLSNIVCRPARGNRGSGKGTIRVRHQTRRHAEGLGFFCRY
jgi:hypothetical protein